MSESGFAEIGEKHLAYRVAGTDSPGIILLNGHNTPMTSWSGLFPAIEKLGMVLTYDRLGTGKSEKPDTPQDGLAIMEGFNAVTAEALMRPPFILIAHSLGGLYANLFARRMPESIAGIVFVESSHPDQARIGPPEPGLVGRTLQRLLGGGFRQDPNSEFNGVDETLAQLDASGPFPSIPITVVTGAKKMPFVPQDQFDLHQQKQRALAALTPDADHIIAQNSGHVPQLSEPDIVLEAIASVLNRIAR